MVTHIGLGTEQTAFLAAAEDKAETIIQLLTLQRIHDAEQTGSAGHVVICAVGKGGGVIVRSQGDPFIPLSGDFCDDVVGFAIIFTLLHTDTGMLCIVAHHFDGRRCVDHGTEHFAFIAHNSLAQVALIDILLGIIHVSIREQNPLCAGLHQVLIAKEADSLGVQENNLVLCAGHADWVQSRHIVQLTLDFAASASVKGFARDVFSVHRHGSAFHFRHSDAEAFKMGGNPEFLTAGFQVFPDLRLLCCSAGMRKIRLLKNLQQSFVCHSASCSILYVFSGSWLSASTPDVPGNNRKLYASGASGLIIT